MAVGKRTLLAASVIAIGALVGSIAGEATDRELSAADGFLKRYSEVLRLVTEYAPRKVEVDELVYSSLDGMLSMLDPHTSFMRPEMYDHMRERQRGSFHGIGVVISLRGGKVTVLSPIEGTPAARAGMRAGDIIESVDGVATDSIDLDESARRLRGPEGTTVTITITRLGLTAPMELTLKRAKVPTESVRYAFMLGKDTGYIRISDFINTSGDEARRALERLQNEGATRLVLDLRDNQGGLVDTAVEVASMLLEPGTLVFSTKGRTADSFQDYRAARDGLHFVGPLVVLVNRGSASAAEIVAGAIQDHDRGLVVGETSFGKGVVQTIYPLRSSGLALTTAKYHTPSGRCIQRDFDSLFSYIRGDDGDEEAPEGQAPTPPAKGEVFYTDAGRKVYGEGGISADHEAKLSDASERVARLLGNSAFFHFAVSYLADKPDKAIAARAFVPDDATLARFRERVIAEKWLPKEEIEGALSDPKDRRVIEISLRSEVLNSGVSLPEGYRALLEGDEQLQAALSYFDEAAKLHASVSGDRKTQLAKR
jgi:carboxyl-terminal processing protease